MAEKRRKIYWDSSIFLAWFKDEARPNHEMDGVYNCVQDVMDGRILLVTSSETQLEVLDAKMTKAARVKFNALFGRRNMQPLPYDLRVQMLAKTIREYYAAGERKTVTSEDAKHLASAIHFGADAFYTFDEGKKGGRSLLSLDGDVAGHNLRICKPPIGQMQMDFLEGQEGRAAAYAVKKSPKPSSAPTPPKDSQ
jgi:predicted nucleic acid-binding protein